jgi:hypothetical protein
MVFLVVSGALGGVFPPGTPLVNVRDLGARGDGVTDDTAAFRAAVAGVDKPVTVYIPDGVYVLSETIAWPRWRTLVGESRDGTVLKLKDGAEGFGDGTAPKPVLQATVRGPHYGNDSWTNAAFGNYIRNLTIDTGRGNSGAAGLRYTTHNYGAVDDVVIRSGDGGGVVGLDLSQTEFGPGAVRNLVVEGFDTGILTPADVSNVTMERITLRNQRVVGLLNHFPVSIAGFRSENRVPAIINRNAGEDPEKHIAQLVLLDAELVGGATDQAAIESPAPLYLRNVRTEGYGVALREAEGREVRGPEIAQHLRGRELLAPGSPPHHLGLEVEQAPVVAEEPLAEWEIVKPPADGKADATAIVQRAFKSGKSTIFFQPGRYTLERTVEIPASVRHVIGVEGTRFFGDPKTFDRKPLLRIAGRTNDPIKLTRISFSAWPQLVYGLEIDSPRPVVMESGGIMHPGGFIKTTSNARGGKLFTFETAAEFEFAPGFKAWLRQWNPENNPFKKGKSDAERVYMVNRGSDVWILGMKTEAPAIHGVVTEGGRVEVLGGFFRDHFGGYEVPYFRVDGRGSVSASYLQFAWKEGECRNVQAAWSPPAGEILSRPVTGGIELLRVDVPAPRKP